jgi:putative transposase
MPQSLSKVYIHIIFSTKNRYPFISNEIKDELCSYISGILINIQSDVIKINGTKDHLHFLCTLPRTISIAKLLEEIKKSSSKWIKTKGNEWDKFAWQDGYGIFSISRSILKKTIDYIENQEEHHKKISFQDELRKFLESYNVDYDEKYLWD